MQTLTLADHAKTTVVSAALTEPFACQWQKHKEIGSFGSAKRFIAMILCRNRWLSASFVTALSMLASVCSAAAGVQFGVVTKFEQGLMTPEMANLVPTAGVSINRDAVAWADVEKTPDQLVWPIRYDRIFAALRQHSIRTVVVLKRSHPIYDAGRFPQTPRAVAAFAHFAAFIAKTLRGQALAFEIGNEWRPSPGQRGPTTPADYAALFVAAANAIHAADPDAQVIADPAIFANLPATAVPAADTAIGSMARSALAVADGVAVHQYPYQNLNMNSAQALDLTSAMMTQRATWLAALAGRPVPLYVTEYGWPMDTTRHLTPADQARLMADMTRRLAAMPFVKVAIAYELVNSCNVAANSECTFGLYDHGPTGVRAKPVLASFRDAVTTVR